MRYLLYNYGDKVMNGQSGFLVGSESFVWTERGLLKICELSTEDKILGIGPEGKHSWAFMNVKKTKQGQIARLTTDSNETLLSANCEIYTIEGIRKVSGIKSGAIIETANIPGAVVDKLAMNPVRSIQVCGCSVEINEKLGYLMGAQIRAKRYADRIVFDQIDINKAPLLASLCNDVRKSLGGGKIYYVAGGKRVRFDSWLLAGICDEMWRTRKILIEIRESPPVVMHSFVAGILDMILQKNNADNPPTFFSTSEGESELRRFMLNIFRMFDVIPPKTHGIFQEDGSIFFRCSINTSDLAKLGLNFIRGLRIAAGLQEMKSISYSLIRNVSSFQGKVFHMLTQEPHWSPIVDLTPLHRHTLA
jgi:hypothetical protein